MGRLLGSGIAGLPGLEETAWPLFSRKSVQRGSSWNLEFVFDVTWALPPGKNDLGEIRWAVRSFFDFKVAIGGNFFFPPRLGLVLFRGAIYSRTSDNK